MSIKNYPKYFEEFLNFKDIQNKQKARGLNDFNLLTTVLKYHDEVRLHSRLIGALLDPNGQHYQGTLFLEKFIKIIGLQDFGLNLSNVTIGIEYKDIDLYITDGVKHIIIENKIWAEDQPCQLIKYINIIIEDNRDNFNDPQENTKIDESLLRIFYLTPRRNKDYPEDHRVDNGYIEYKNGTEALKKCSDNKKIIDFDLKNYKVKYKKIDYKKIFQWLEVSHKEVNNITNLSESIKQYMAVVERVNKNYIGNVMTLENYMDSREEMYEYLEELTEVKNKIEPKFWSDLFEKLNSDDFLKTLFDIKFNYKSDYKNKPEIKLISKSDEGIFIFIRRSHNTFYGITLNEQNDNLNSKGFTNKGTNYWAYTQPTINFHKCNKEYWKIAKPSQRNATTDSIVKQILELVNKVIELNIIYALESV